MIRKYWMRVAWPAFLAACLLELLVFAMVDPGELRWVAHGGLASRQGIYTLAFFAFWVIAMASCALTVLLGTPQDDVARRRRD